MYSAILGEVIEFFFYKLDEIGNIANISIRDFTT